ncbi:MBL fold metallo-hydrolase [Blautia sp. HCP3S3_G3]|uniref:MBL fold metallo-hydrolase n=1 Tax=Blautia sp. HCP3S3_G3 TaxID=3438913 RepID=UPI003F8CAD7B
MESGLKEKILGTELLPSQVALFYLGQVGFILKYQGKYLMIDGYLSDYVDRNFSSDLVQWKRLYPSPIRSEELDFLDYVFCTHTHCDHADPDTLKAVAECNQKAVFMGCASVCSALKEYGIPAERICKIKADEEMLLEGNIRVTGVPAAHEELHPDGEGGYEETGILFALGEKKIFHSGDCCPYDGLEQRIQNCDALILPVNGRDYYRTYVKDIIGCFDSVEAITIARNTNAGLLMPVHWDLYEVNSVNPGIFADAIHRLAPSLPYHIFVPGERYILA